MAILQQAARKGKTMGKYLNEILDEKAKEDSADGHVAASPICIVCGQKATFEGMGKGQQKLFVCSFHKGLAQKMSGYRELRVQDGTP
jgi:hypothetical protein